MTPGGLVQYFRSFLIKINMIESVLGQLELGGEFVIKSVILCDYALLFMGLNARRHLICRHN